MNDIEREAEEYAKERVGHCRKMFTGRADLPDYDDLHAEIVCGFLAGAAEQVGRDQAVREANEVIELVSKATENTQAWLREKGIIFDKWPLHPDRDRATMTREEYWQGVAFNIYTDIVELTEKARHYLATQQEKPEGEPK